MAELIDILEDFNNLKKYLIIPALIFTLITCNEDRPEELYECLNQFGEFEPNEKPYAGESSYNILKGREIDIQREDENIYMYLNQGDQLVFRYEFNKDDNPRIADDEYGEAIYFQVDPALDSFHFDSNDLFDARAVFGKFCFCVDGGYHRVDEGCIHGEKITEKKWKISFSLKISTTTYEPITLMVNREFVLSDN